MDPVDEVVKHLQDTGCQAALVAQEGQLDVSSLLAAGWTIDEQATVYMHGKRIRTMRAPS